MVNNILLFPPFFSSSPPPLFSSTLFPSSLHLLLPLLLPLPPPPSSPPPHLLTSSPPLPSSPPLLSCSPSTVGSHAEDSIDEPYMPRYTPHLLRGGVAVHPIPIAAPTTPSRHRRSTPPGSPITQQPLQLSHQGSHPPYLTDFPDGGMTDMTYTTDEETVGTTSVPPSSAGSPNMVRRHFSPHISHHSPHYHQDHGHFDHTHIHPPHHVHEMSENPYVAMQRGSPVYARIRRTEDPAVSPPPHLTPPGSPGKGSSYTYT